MKGPDMRHRRPFIRLTGARALGLTLDEEVVDPYLLELAEDPARLYIAKILSSPADYDLDDSADDFRVRAQAVGRELYEIDHSLGVAFAAPSLLAPDVPDEHLHVSVVYYMRLGNMIKIGTTEHISRRLKSVTAQGVMAVEYGSYELETTRHRQLTAYHIHGEWYALTPEIALHIVDIRRKFQALTGETVEEWLIKQGVAYSKF